MCSDDGYWFTSIYGFQMRVSLDKNGCFLSKEFYFFDDRNALTSAILEEGFWDCCGSFPIRKTFLGSDGKTVTKVEKFGKDGCLTETDAFVYDDKGQLKDEIISDQYYNYNCLVISPEPTPVAGRVTHKTVVGGVKLQETETSLYDGDGHLVSVTTFDDQGRAKRSDARASSAPSGQSEVPVSSVTNGSNTTQISTYDGKGHLVSVTTLDDQGRVKRSDARPQFTPSGQAGGTAGVAGTNAAVVRHPGQSFKGLKRAQGGTAGAAGPGTTTSSGDSGVATSGTEGVAGTSSTPSGGGNSAPGGTAGVASTATGQGGRDVPQREPTPNKKKKVIRIRSSSATANTGLSGGNSATGATAGVAGGSSGQTDAGNKSKIIWQKSSSAATNTGSSSSGGVHNSAIGGSGGKQTGDQMMKQRETGKGTKPTPTPTVVPR